jgi:hypothetical protein
LQKIPPVITFVFRERLDNSVDNQHPGDQQKMIFRVKIAKRTTLGGGAQIKVPPTMPDAEFLACSVQERSLLLDRGLDRNTGKDESTRNTIMNESADFPDRV